MGESSAHALSGRQEYIGRSPETPIGGSSRKDISEWIVPVLVLVLVVGIISLGVTGGPLATALIVLPVMAIGLTEFDRRRLRNASFGYVDAAVAPGVMRFGSSPHAVWVGIAVVVLGAATLVIYLIVLPALTDGSARRRSDGLLLLAGLICIALGVRIAWAALRSGAISIDARGVTLARTLFGRTRVVPWSHGSFAQVTGGSLIVASGTLSVACRVSYLRTDPVIVADIINRCASDPAWLMRLGGEMIDVLKAEEPWRRNRHVRRNRHIRGDRS